MRISDWSSDVCSSDLYVKFWARAADWVQHHQDEWIKSYYVQDQGVSVEDAKTIIRNTGRYDIRHDWNEIIALKQETIDFMERETSQKKFQAETLFARRSEKNAASAISRSSKDSREGTEWVSTLCSR